MSTLQEYLLENEEQKERFTIDNDESANWALRKIKHIQEQAKANKDLADKEVRKITDWLINENKALEENINFFTGLLQEYALKQRQADDKFKKRKLPLGEIKFTKQQPKFEYDDDQLVKELKDNQLSDYIKTKEEPKWGDLKKKGKVQGNKFVYDGTIIEAVTVTEREDKFSIEVD